MIRLALRRGFETRCALREKLKLPFCQAYPPANGGKENYHQGGSAPDVVPWRGEAYPYAEDDHSVPGIA